jgi:hypothetical protein
MSARLFCTAAIFMAAVASAGAASAPTTLELANRFPDVVRQVLASDPRAGSEAQYFARLSNLMTGSPVPASLAHSSATIDHLAHAQADLDRGNVAGAVAETRSATEVRGAVAAWLKDAETRLALDHGQPRSRVQIARARPASTPLVMPTEIPAYARESSGPLVR